MCNEGYNMKNGEDTDRVEYFRGNRELARTDTTSGTRRNANNKILVIIFYTKNMWRKENGKNIERRHGEKKRV
jgi:hypothetical protein